MNEQQFTTLKNSIQSFKYFVNDILSLSLQKFVRGKFVNETADFLQNNKKTVRVSAKDHFKSTSLYAYFMWKLLNSYGEDLECHYFSYDYSMAAYHLRKIKEHISRNPFFQEVRDCKKSAEAVLKYTWDGEHFATIYPHGMLAFKRGIHADIIFVDDPFQDPANKLDPVIVEKINRLFVSNIMDMPKKDGELHVVGTPQTSNDFFFNKDIMSRFAVKIMPAVINEVEKEVLWPEHMDYKELIQRRRERGEKLFNQEYMCLPAYSETSYFSREQIFSVVNPSLQNLNKLDTSNKVFLGWDIGKKRHPSHVSVFEKTGDKFVMVFHLFMDNWDYNDQVNYINGLMEDFTVYKGFYDGTRGELESFKERGELHRNLEPVIMSNTTKQKLAGNLDALVSNKNIELINDSRLINQILNVDGDLNAFETHEGHGDSFWSIALACQESKEESPGVIRIW